MLRIDAIMRHTQAKAPLTVLVKDICGCYGVFVRIDHSGSAVP